MNCRKVNSKLADLLLDPQSVPAELRQHVEECAGCGRELGRVARNDGIVGRLGGARGEPVLRREAAVAAADRRAGQASGFLGTMEGAPHVRQQPADAAADGGRSGHRRSDWRRYVCGSFLASPPQREESAAVRDLQSLDGNAQVFQQLDSVDQSAQQDDQDSGTAVSIQRLADGSCRDFLGSGARVD